MRSAKRLAGLAALLWIGFSVGAPSFAEEAPALSVTLMTREITVAEDGRTDTTVHVQIHIGNESAAMTGGQQAVTFSADTETLEIIEAHTLKPDGKRIAVAPSSIYEQQAPGTQQVLMYTDQRQKVIVFPQVATGDDLIYTARISQKAPLIPGQFWDSGTFNASAALREVHETVTVPKALALYVDTKGLAYSRDETAPRSSIVGPMLPRQPLTSKTGMTSRKPIRLISMSRHSRIIRPLDLLMRCCRRRRSR
ncbi:MAG TPA: DUF3857 domain-containing protein [Rhizomicrobium sp.]|nr:DUF3857 domain-containing protein [Rhizomicrobium sp.]